jgi:hypothetical protein
MKGKNRDERMRALRDQRISHVYVNWSEIERYRAPGNYGFTDYVTKPLVRNELAEDQGLLRRVPSHVILQRPPMESDIELQDRFEVFEVPRVIENGR